MDKSEDLSVIQFAIKNRTFIFLSSSIRSTRLFQLFMKLKYKIELCMSGSE